MCMVAIDDRLVDVAVENNVIEKDNFQTQLEQMFSDFLIEKVKAERRKRILQFEGSNIWEGNLEEMRACR